jgi:hypothetical protein
MILVPLDHTINPFYRMRIIFQVEEGRRVINFYDGFSGAGMKIPELLKIHGWLIEEDGSLRRLDSQQITVMENSRVPRIHHSEVGEWYTRNRGKLTAQKFGL